MTLDDSGREPVTVTVPAEDEGARLDAFLAARFPDHSRVNIRKAITAGSVAVDGCHAKPSYRIHAGQVIRFQLPDLPVTGPQPENIPLSVLYEDEDLVAIDKPPGMVVHPAKGHWSGTLTSALAYHFEQLSSAGGATRPGIVHRLDRDTSGVLVVAKNDRTHLALAAQFEARTARKEYLAIVVGVPDRDRDIIDQPIGIHPYQREKMAIRPGHDSSREATTFFEVLERFDGYAFVRLKPKTGRTHQLRVHLAHIGFPVLCDRLYGGRSEITAQELGGNSTEIVLSRQALHAHCLTLEHPITKTDISFSAPLHADMEQALRLLRP